MGAQELLFSLGNHNGWQIANTLSTTSWMTASEVAKQTGVQIATAVTHLKRFYDVGLTNRQVRSGRKDAFEYQLKSDEVQIHLVLGADDEDAPLEDMIRTFSDRLKEVLGKDFDTFIASLPKDMKSNLSDIEKKKFKGGSESASKVLGHLVRYSIHRLGGRTATGLLALATKSQQEAERLIESSKEE